MNGRAAAPPAMACRIGVSTSMYPFELKYSRMELYTLLRLMKISLTPFVDSQVDIALAVTQFRIFKRVVSYAVFVFNNRQWFDRFGEHRQLFVHGY